MQNWQILFNSCKLHLNWWTPKKRQFSVHLSFIYQDILIVGYYIFFEYSQFGQLSLSTISPTPWLVKFQIHGDIIFFPKNNVTLMALMRMMRMMSMIGRVKISQSATAAVQCISPKLTQIVKAVCRRQHQHFFSVIIIENIFLHDINEEKKHVGLKTLPWDT